MHFREDPHSFFDQLLLNPAVQQVAPLLVLLFIPLLLLFAQNHRRTITSSIFMFFESLALVLPWNWTGGHTSNGSSEKRKSRKLIRTRAEQLNQKEGSAHDSGIELTSTEVWGNYPGLVNVSGTYCFMNSTLQALSSLCYLQPQLDDIYAKAEAIDVPTPVIDALRNLLCKINTPAAWPSPIRPIEIINALSDSSNDRHNSLFSSREHQDAQELFQLLSECIKNEAVAVDKEMIRDRGLGGLTNVQGRPIRELGKSVFEGLTANRRSCMECGYTEAVMHFPFDNWQLTVPPLTSCHLEDCLRDYTRLEILSDCICRKCSMMATLKRLQQEAETLTEATNADSQPSASKKKRAREGRKLLMRFQTALNEGRIEDDIKGVKMEKVFSKASTKQAMIARPPPVLALHLNRSMHYGGNYASKNSCRVLFPEILDLTPFTTSGKLSTEPSFPISSPPPAVPRSTTPTPATYAAHRTLYRLSAVVCHYGQHSFGHYVCYRRKPRPSSAGARRFAPSKLACPLGCECEKCERYGSIRDDEEQDGGHPPPGHGWLRISDESVRGCGIDTVLQEASAAFMIYYERVVMPHPPVYLSNTPRSSEETVRPENVPTVHANGSSASLSSLDDTAMLEVIKPIPVLFGPRIVRSTSAPRTRSPSAMPPEQVPDPAPHSNVDKAKPNGHAEFIKDLTLPSTNSPPSLEPIRSPSPSPMRETSSPSPSRHSRHQHPIKYAQSIRPISPARTVDLCA